MTSKNRNQLIYLVSIIGFFGIFSTTMAKNPVLSLFINSLGTDEKVIGIISAISPFAGIVLSFPVGMLSDKLGRKKLLIFSALVFFTAPLLYLLITNPWWLIPIRFFHGMATAILGPVAAAIICDAYPDSKGEKLGTYSSVTLIGRTIAPIVGGSIISFFMYLHSPWTYKLVYAGCFILTIPILIASLLIKEKKSDRTELKKVTLNDFWASIKTFMGNKKLSATAFVELATYFTFGVFESYLPIYLSKDNFPPYLIGIIFSIQVLSIALSKPFFGRLSDHIDRRLQIALGIFIISFSFGILPLSINFAYLVFVSVLFGIGQSLSTVATFTYVADVAKKEALGSSLGALSSIKDIGHSGGPLAAGFIIGYAGYHYGFMSCMALALISGVVFILATKTPKTT